MRPRHPARIDRLTSQPLLAPRPARQPPGPDERPARVLDVGSGPGSGRTTLRSSPTRWFVGLDWTGASRAPPPSTLPPLPLPLSPRTTVFFRPTSCTGPAVRGWGPPFDFVHQRLMVTSRSDGVRGPRRWPTCPRDAAVGWVELSRWTGGPSGGPATERLFLAHAKGRAFVRPRQGRRVIRSGLGDHLRAPGWHGRAADRGHPGGRWGCRSAR